MYHMFVSKCMYTSRMICVLMIMPVDVGCVDADSVKSGWERLRVSGKRMGENSEGGEVNIERERAVTKINASSAVLGLQVASTITRDNRLFARDGAKYSSYINIYIVLCWYEGRPFLAHSISYAKLWDTSRITITYFFKLYVHLLFSFLSTVTASFHNSTNRVIFIFIYK